MNNLSNKLFKKGNFLRFYRTDTFIMLKIKKTKEYNYQEIYICDKAINFKSKL